MVVLPGRDHSSTLPARIRALLGCRRTGEPQLPQPHEGNQRFQAAKEGYPTQVHIRTRTWDLTLGTALCASPNTTRPHHLGGIQCSGLRVNECKCHIIKGLLLQQLIGALSFILHTYVSWVPSKILSTKVSTTSLYPYQGWQTKPKPICPPKPTQLLVGLNGHQPNQTQ